MAPFKGHWHLNVVAGTMVHHPNTVYGWDRLRIAIVEWKTKCSPKDLESEKEIFRVFSYSNIFLEVLSPG